MIKTNTVLSKHHYSHDVRLRRIGISRRLEVSCHTPECNGARVFRHVTMAYEDWAERLNAFHKKHPAFSVKDEGESRE